MIAADTSTFSRYISGVVGRDTRILQDGLESDTLYLPHVVITELLSNPALRDDAKEIILAVPRLPITSGYWERAGLMRADLAVRVRKHYLGDCLIAQSCIDNEVPLITYDRDYRHFQVAGLKLL